ncbi:MAG: flavodoxin family protein, partial [Verrucomicrobiota bacterium]
MSDSPPLVPSGPDLQPGPVPLGSRILVLFDSRTGNVARMAELVAEGARQVPDTEVRLRSVDTATADDVVWCHGLAVGSPTNMGILSWKMKRFWDETMGDRW